MANIIRAKEPTNLKGINLNSIETKDTNKFFNNFFDIPVEVSSNVNDAIVALFEQIADNKESARALASAVIYTSVKQGINPMDTFKEFQRLPPGEIDAYTAMFLNFERKGTSYIGISTQPQISKYIQRSIKP